MPSNYKPGDHNSVSPYLIVPHAAEVIEFLKQAFGAVELLRIPAPAGQIMHAEVRLDDSVVMLGDAGPDWPASSAHIHVYVPDVDQTYERAIAAGGIAVQPPTKKDDPDRRGGFKDPAGTTWWIATRVG